MKNSEQKFGTIRFNVLKSAEDFKKRSGSKAKIKVYKDGKFGVRFKFNKELPKSEQL